MTLPWTKLLARPVLFRLSPFSPPDSPGRSTAPWLRPPLPPETPAAAAFAAALSWGRGRVYLPPSMLFFCSSAFFLASFSSM